MFLVCAPSADPNLPFRNLAFWDNDKKVWYGLIAYWLQALTHWCEFPELPSRAVMLARSRAIDREAADARYPLPRSIFSTEAPQ